MGASVWALGASGIGVSVNDLILHHFRLPPFSYTSSSLDRLLSVQWAVSPGPLTILVHNDIGWYYASFLCT